MVYNPSQPLVLRGLITGLSDNAFFELCQANELAHIKRTPQHDVIIRPLPGFTISELVGNSLFQIAAWSHRHGGHTLSWAGYT